MSQNMQPTFPEIDRLSITSGEFVRVDIPGPGRKMVWAMRAATAVHIASLLESARIGNHDIDLDRKLEVKLKGGHVVVRIEGWPGEVRSSSGGLRALAERLRNAASNSGVRR